MRTFAFILLLGIGAANAAGANSEPMRMEVHVWGGTEEARAQLSECVHRQLDKYDEWSVRVVPNVLRASGLKSRRLVQVPVAEVLTRTHHRWGSQTESFEGVVLKLTCPRNPFYREPWNPRESPTK